MSATEEEESLQSEEGDLAEDYEIEPFYYKFGRGERELRGKFYRSRKDKELECFESHEGVIYRLGDTVYLETGSHDAFLIGTLNSFKPTKRERDFVVTVTRYYRPDDVPDDSLSLLAAERGEGAECAARPREIFTCDVTATYSVAALRGRCTVHLVRDVGASRELDLASEDVFFSCVTYNNESTRLATHSGEIRVGHSHQARLPPEATSSMAEDKDRDELLWRPGMIDEQLEMKYIRLARTFRHCLLNDSPIHDRERGARTTDLLLDDAMTTLHRCSYSFKDALKEMNANDQLLISDANFMTPDDTKKFTKGIKTLGKNFTRISRELLPLHSREQLVAFYYLWKKTSDATKPKVSKAMGRSRNGTQKKKNGTSKNSSSSSRELNDYASASEAEIETLEEAKRVQYACHHCYSSKSRDWHHAGRDNQLLCTDCRLFFKKYGQLRPVDRPSTVPPCLFKRSTSDTDQEEEGVRTRAGKKEGRKRSPSWGEDTSPLTAQSIHEFDMEKKKKNGGKRRKSHTNGGSKKRREEKEEAGANGEGEDDDKKSTSPASPEVGKTNGEWKEEDEEEEKKCNGREEMKKESEEGICQVKKEEEEEKREEEGATREVKEERRDDDRDVPSTSNGVKEDEEGMGGASDDDEGCSLLNKPDPLLSSYPCSSFIRVYERGSGNACSRSDLAFVSSAEKDQRRRAIREQESSRAAPHRRDPVLPANQSSNPSNPVPPLVAPIPLLQPSPADMANLMRGVPPMGPPPNASTPFAHFAQMDPRILMLHQQQAMQQLNEHNQLAKQLQLRQEMEAALSRRDGGRCGMNPMGMPPTSQMMVAPNALNGLNGMAAAFAQAQQQAAPSQEQMEAQQRELQLLIRTQMEMQMQAAAAHQAQQAAAAQAQQQQQTEALQQFLVQQQLALMGGAPSVVHPAYHSEMMRRLQQEGFRPQ